jgi:hypothetical protein
MFPEQDTFLPNIMKFCGYLNRNSILKLKSAPELQRMLDYVVKMAELVPDKQAMFGIFAPKPALLAEFRMPPGTHSTFDRFIDRVDKLTAKPVKLKPQRRAKTSNTNLTAADASSTQLAGDTESSAAATMDAMKERFRKWFSAELPKIRCPGTFMSQKNVRGLI